MLVSLTAFIVVPFIVSLSLYAVTVFQAQN